ncbi:MAG: hypothetical protein WDW38_004030 [Sanguina aurantia]
MSTTGGKVWDAARRLCTYMEAEAGSLGLHRPEINILELGAGVGHTSLCLARNLPSVGRVCATDMATDGAVEWLQHNVQLNHAVLGPAAASRLVVLPCDWRDYGCSTPGSRGGVAHQVCAASGGAVGGPTGTRTHQHCKRARSAAASSGGTPEDVTTTESTDTDHTCSSPSADAEGPSQGASSCPDPLDCTQWDLVIGSDLVYNDIGCALLPHVLRRFAGPHTTILYAHTRHRFDNYDQMFLEGVAAVGLLCSEVREEGCETPPPSPPPLTELFPEMRIAVYRMALAQ